MDEFTLVQIPIPKAVDYALSDHLTLLRRSGVKITKAELIIKLMRIGLLKESAKLITEGRTEI